MKNAMKKIMSLVLVAMILVSALPFAASAAGYDVVVAGTPVGVYESITYEEALALSGIDTSAYDVTAIYNIHEGEQGIPFTPGQTIDLNAIGTIVYIWYETEEKTTTPPPAPTPDPEPTAYPMSIDVDGEQKVLTDKVSVTYEEVLKLVGLKAAQVDYIVYEGTGVSGTQFLDAGDTINLAGETRIFVFTEPTSGSNGNSGNNANPGFPGFPSFPNVEPNKPDLDGSNDKGYYKLSGDVVLEICVDQNQKPAKTISIKEGIAADGRVNLNEVKGVVKYYYNAVDADTGIVYDGLYKGQTFSENIIEWVKDTKFDTVTGLYEAANNCKVVTIRVYISNAKLATTSSSSSSSSNADSTNPKTGDTIMMPVAVMTASASILAVAFYMNKKRAF